MLAFVNYITKPNLLQHLKVIQRSTTFYSSVIHLLAKIFIDSGTARLQKNSHLPFNTDGSHASKGFVRDANPGYREYTIYGSSKFNSIYSLAINMFTLMRLISGFVTFLWLILDGVK